MCALDGAHVRGRFALAPERTSRRQAWESTAGLEVMPLCDACGSSTVWKGSWVCVGCAARSGTLQPYAERTAPPAMPREALAGVPIFSSSEGNNSTASEADWRYAVESLTSMHRSTVSARLLKRGTRRTETQDESWDDDGVITTHGPLTNGTPVVNRWHAQRMLGQAERFERVAHCGTFEHGIDYVAPNGERKFKAIRARCDCWRVCTKCQNRRKWKLSDGMKQQRARALEVHKWAARRGYRGTEGKWSEKLLSFTVPHGPNGPADDARKLVDAWQRLLRRVRAHLVERGAYRLSPTGRKVAVSVPWCRALEVATRNEHHAHMHVWYFGPYLDVVLMHAWWGELMQEQGLTVPVKTWGTIKAEARARRRTIDRRMQMWLDNPTDETPIPWGIVDLTSDRSAEGAVAAYSQKVGLALYVVKGLETQRMSPAHVAAIYETFEGTRAVQWARGWAPPKKALAAKCITFRRLTDEEKRMYNHTRSHGTNAHQNDSGSALTGLGALGATTSGHLESGQGKENETWSGKDGPYARANEAGGVPIPAQLTLPVDMRKRARGRKSW